MGRVSYVDGVRGPASVRMRAHCPEILAALAEVSRAMWHKSFLDPALRELVRLQVASLSQCLSCLALRYVPGKRAGLTDDKIQRLPDFESDAFTEREKAALRFTTAMVRNPKGIDDRFFTELQRHFTEAELVDLGLSVGLFHGLGLFNLAFGAEPEPFGTEYSV